MFKFDDRLQFDQKDIDVLTIGELLIDMISDQYGESGESTTYNQFFGGSPSNIAMNAKSLGIRSRIASAVGNDGLGKFLVGKLEKANMDTTCLQYVDYSTSMVVVTKSQGTPIPIFYRGADYNLEFTAQLEDSIKNAKVIHFSCWPISMLPVRNTIEKAIEVARANNVLVAFDPNYHPMIWQKGEDGAAYVRELIGRVDIVKPSEDDAERIFGKDTPENHVQRFLELGAKLVIMTLGKDGALISNGLETLRLPTMATEIIDTTGAGDAFWSGFYTGVIKGYTIRESLMLGFAVSAHKLKFLGAVVDLPSIESIKELYNV